MSPGAENPYPVGTTEHHYWNTWNRAYFSQPVHAQLIDLEGQLRNTLASLLKMADLIETEADRTRMRAGLLELEAIIELVSEAAEHAFIKVVKPLNGSHP